VRGVTAGGAGRDEARRSLSELGAWSTPELRVAGVFAVVALAWITRPFLQQIPGLSGLSDMGIAVMGAVAMFLVPAQKDQGMLLDWEHARRLPWRVVILFGGGLSLAAGISQSGLAGWAGEQLAGLGVMPWFVMALVVTVLVIFATEIMSNVATISAAAPVLIALGTAAGIDPVVIAAPAAMAASCAFMLPVATGPNAIVYAGGRVSMGQMIRAGFALNIIAALIVAFLAGWLGRVVFGG
jgi:sodium-dependent dicarboxylate transporter 2/3/5